MRLYTGSVPLRIPVEQMPPPRRRRRRGLVFGAVYGAYSLVRDVVGWALWVGAYTTWLG